MRHQQIGPVGGAEKVLVTLPHKGHHNTADQKFRPLPGIKNPPYHLRDASELGFQRAQDGKPDPLDFDRLAIAVERGDGRAMAPRFEFLREGEVGV